MWVFLDDHTLQPILTKVPRVLYINTRKQNLFQFSISKCARLVERALPRGRNSLNLYEVTLDEAAFVKQSKHLTTALTNPEVEGVYESKVGDLI